MDGPHFPSLPSFKTSCSGWSVLMPLWKAAPEVKRGNDRGQQSPVLPGPLRLVWALSAPWWSGVGCADSSPRHPRGNPRVGIRRRQEKNKPFPTLMACHRKKWRHRGLRKRQHSYKKQNQNLGPGTELYSFLQQVFIKHLLFQALSWHRGPWQGQITRPCSISVMVWELSALFPRCLHSPHCG